ncbi:VOC family protein [Nocardia sp. GCM10030253]|uniref:VOC family protein n=1 Tax=Nocardia sp. GCM10030253 TaxID=3273404 RepID=UPI0036281322
MTIKGASPYLRYADADTALDWMEQVLGLTGTIRWRDDTGRTYEADIFAGVTKIGVSASGNISDDGKNAILIVHVDDVEAHYARIKAAATVAVEPPIDQPYGPRTFTITDPWGYHWNFWQGEATPPEDHPVPPS